MVKPKTDVLGVRVDGPSYFEPAVVLKGAEAHPPCPAAWSDDEGAIAFEVDSMMGGGTIQIMDNSNDDPEWSVVFHIEALELLLAAARAVERDVNPA